MDNREKYRSMGDHDILVEVAVRQEILTETVDKVCVKVDDHESRLATREAVCDETRKTIFSEVDRLRENNPDKRVLSFKERATIGGGAFTVVGSLFFAAGKALGWW